MIENEPRERLESALVADDPSVEARRRQLRHASLPAQAAAARSQQALGNARAAQQRAQIARLRLDLADARRDGRDAGAEALREEIALRILQGGGVSGGRFRPAGGDGLTPALFWCSNPGGDTGWYSRSWFAFTGQTAEDAQGFGWLDAIHPDDRDLSLARYRAAVESGVALRREHRIRCARDRSYRRFRICAAPDRAADLSIRAWYGCAIDMAPAEG